MVSGLKVVVAAALCVWGAGPAAGAGAAYPGAGCPSECCSREPCVCGYASCDGLGLWRVPSGYFPNVSYIDLGHNKISELQDLSGFPNIRTIYIHFNRLTTLDLSKFPVDSLLDNIYVTNNKIASIRQPAPGVSFPLVRSLFLSSNALTAIAPGDLEAFPLLDSIMLEGNPLVQLPVAAVEGRFTRSGIIRMATTPLACSCGFQELFQWGKENGVYVNAICLEQNCGF